MPSIKTLMTKLGFHNQGADFYIPRDHPHAHVRVTNASKEVNDVPGIRQYISFIALSFGDGVNTVSVYRRDPAGRPPEQLENGNFSPAKKARLETALHDKVGMDATADIQRALNLLTGIGIDFG